MNKLRVSKQLQIERIVGRKLEAAYAVEGGLISFNLVDEPNRRYRIDLKTGAWQEFAPKMHAPLRIGVGHIEKVVWPREEE